jgi:hypothetical protein
LLTSLSTIPNSLPVMTLVILRALSWLGLVASAAHGPVSNICLQLADVAHANGSPLRSFGFADGEVRFASFAVKSHKLSFSPQNIEPSRNIVPPNLSGHPTPI